MFIVEHPKSLGKTLSLLWMFAILNVLFRDVHELTTASAANEILTGYVNGNPVTEEVLFYAAFGVELFLLGSLLSQLLRPIFARWYNLVSVPSVLAGMLMSPPADLDDYFFATVVISTLIAIFVIALRWDTKNMLGQIQEHDRVS